MVIIVVVVSLIKFKQQNVKMLSAIIDPVTKLEKTCLCQKIKKKIKLRKKKIEKKNFFFFSFFFWL